MRGTRRSNFVFGWLAMTIVIVAACSSVGSTGSPGSSIAPTSNAESTLTRITREKAMRVGFANEAPFAYSDGDKLTGEAPETLRAFAKTIGVDQLDGVLIEFAGLIPSLKATRVDAIAAGMYIRPARCKEVAFSEPEFALGGSLIVKKGNPKGLTDWKAIAANTTAKMGVVSGSASEEYTKYNNISADRVSSFPDVQSMVSALQGGRIDVAPVDTLSGIDLIKKSGDPNLELLTPKDQPVDAAGKPAIGYGAIAFRPEDTNLRDAYNAWLVKAKQNGDLLKIISPFGFRESEIAPAGTKAEDICKG